MEEKEKEIIKSKKELANLYLFLKITKKQPVIKNTKIIIFIGIRTREKK